MPLISKTIIYAMVVVTALWMEPVGAAEEAGAKPGDEALTCDQIFAQGMAETKRSQEERDKKNEQRKAQTAATAALITSTVATGGMSGTGPAAQKSAENLADGQMAELAAPSRANPRMEYLKQLYAQKHCASK
jgi:hypothetical protein